MNSLSTPTVSAVGKLDSLQMWRAIAAFLVVLRHLAAIPDRRWSTSDGQRTWLALFEAIGFAGVDLFFVISGVVMVVTSYRHLGDARQIVPFLERRVVRIYPLYWACFATVLALGSVAPSLVSRTDTDPLVILKTFALWPQDFFPIVGVAWTLTYEMFFYIVFAGLIAIPRRHFTKALGVWAASVFVLFWFYDEPAYHSFPGNLKLPLMASPLVLEFIAGCAIGWLLCRTQLRWPAAALLLGVVWFVGLGSYYGATYYDEASYGAVRVAVFGVPSALLIYGAAGLERQGRLKRSPALVFWGDASYSLYLSHIYVIRAFGELYSRWPSAQKGPLKGVLLVACLVACGIVAAASYVWFERPVTRLCRQWLDRSTADIKLAPRISHGDA